MTEFIWSSAASLAKMIRNREVSAKELVNAHLQHIEVVNPALNAVVQIAAQRALNEARELDKMLAKGQGRGLLHGVPITIKDSLDTEGIITTWGTEGRRSFIPDKDGFDVNCERPVRPNRGLMWYAC
jgi:amidase